MVGEGVHIDGHHFGRFAYSVLSDQHLRLCWYSAAQDRALFFSLNI